MPQVTVGAMSSPSIRTTSSYSASASEAIDFQCATARSQAASSGAYSRPRRYANVVSSGLTYPTRAPPSMAMLHTVIRPSMDIDSMTEPAYS